MLPHSYSNSVVVPPDDLEEEQPSRREQWLQWRELKADGFRSCSIVLDPIKCPVKLVEAKMAANAAAAAAAVAASPAPAVDSSFGQFAAAAALFPTPASSIETKDPVESHPSRSARSRAHRLAAAVDLPPAPARARPAQPKRPKSTKKKPAAPASATKRTNLNITQRLNGTHLDERAAAASAASSAAASAAAAAAKSAELAAQLKQVEKQLAQEKKEHRSLQTKLTAQQKTILTLQHEKDQAQAALRDERAKSEPPRLNVPPLPRLDHPSSRAVKGKAGGPLRVLYALSSNSDQDIAPHYLPDEIVRQMRWDIHDIVKDPAFAEEQQRWMIEEDSTAKNSHTDAPELFLKAEARALPLYLQKLFATHFDVRTEPLELVQRLLIALDAGSNDRQHATRGAVLMTDGVKSQDAQQLRDLLGRIKSSDVLVLPSVLLFTDKERGARFWYSALRRLKTETNVIVFPLIDVEARMELKDSYLTALMRSPKQYLPRGFNKQELGAAEYASSPLDKIRNWAGRVTFVHEPANRHLAPTVLLPDFSQLLDLKESKQRSFIHSIFKALQADVIAGGWSVAENRYFIKGTASTRSNVAEEVSSAEEALNFMKKVCKEGHLLCAAQVGFILQPSMTGLSLESRTYFNRGRSFPLTLLSSRPPSKKVSAMDFSDLRGQELPAHRNYALSEPQRTDFAQHILQLCEDHCKLVSCSGILRVDLGEEYLHCDNASAMDNRDQRLLAETELCSKQPRPCLWHCTGHGFIVRFFLNEVTSTLDINWFSQLTNFPIVYEAAYATAQQLIRVARIRARITKDREEPEEEEAGRMEDVLVPALESLPADSASAALPVSPASASITVAASAASSPKRKQTFESSADEEKENSAAKRIKPELQLETAANVNGVAAAADRELKMIANGSADQGTDMCDESTRTE